MRVVLSADMEGIAGMRSTREVLACCAEYWDSGRTAYTADVAAAAQGLLDAGATEVIVLDNHASGNPHNLLADQLPHGVREESWNVFDLPAQGIDAMLQVGYHPRGGVAGFVPHTYTPGLRLRVGEEEISESHGRAWAAQVPLLGITGNAAHRASLGSLSDTPFLVVQQGEDPHTATPVLDEPAEAIREFAREALRRIADAPRPEPPAAVTFEATIRGERLFAIELAEWADAREPLASAMGTAMQPFMGHLRALDLSSREAFERQDPGACEELTALFLDAVATS
jgi:D-amino peptidase